MSTCSNSTGTVTVPVEKEREDSTSPEQTTTGETAYELRNLPIAAELRRLRGKMTLREVEGQTGIPNPYLSNLERGIKRPGFKILHQLGVRQSRYFGRTKTLYQLLLAATVANLTLVATKHKAPKGGAPKCHQIPPAPGFSDRPGRKRA